MSPQLAGRIEEERRRRFVGRTAELGLFGSAISSDELPFNVLYVHGPGGMGKTTLLGEFSHLCRSSGIQASYVDARNLEPSPDSFMAALLLVLNLDPQSSPLETFASQTSRQVVMVDTCETLASLNPWINEVFLPRIPENTLLVMASRNAPEARWRTDPGWQSLVRVLPLGNLSKEESRVYLSRRNVPADQHQPVLEFTHGHPLALSLVADAFVQRSGFHFQPEATPDVIKALLEQFVQRVPGPAHRTALESCALVRQTTESLLSHMVGISEVHELFEWLRELAFIESGPFGLFPHDVAREALAADLRWRNPDWYAELHHRARNYYKERLKQTHGRDQQRVLFDYIYLHRDNPVIRPFLEWQETGAAAPEAMQAGDEPDLVTMVAAHEGEESARLAAYWFGRQPQNVVIYRDLEGKPAGFVLKLALHETSPEDRKRDPAVRAACQYLENHAPLRSGEKATLFRFWMARESYQEVSAMQSLIFGNVAQHYLTTPSLAFSFFPTANPDFWAQAFAYFELPRLPEADFEVGGRRYGIYAHDWRVMPPMAWLDLLAEREVATEPLAARETEPLVVLGEGEFAEAVREALRSFCRPDALGSNPLLHSRAVAERAGAGSSASERISALRELIEEAAGSLQDSPREAKFYRALYHTYLNPAPSQERAAMMLNIPFSTYRRHLKGGISRVAEVLWQKEIGAR